MKYFISLLAINIILSAAVMAEAEVIALPGSNEYLCEGENSEHFIRLKVLFNESLKILQLDMLQETQNNDGPYPLLPLQYNLNSLSGRLMHNYLVYDFAPNNYQSCEYKFLWPLGSGPVDEVTGHIHLDCDGVRSQIQLDCSRSDSE